MIFVPALVGAFLPQTLLAKIENFRSLAFGKGRENLRVSSCPSGQTVPNFGTNSRKGMGNCNPHQGCQCVNNPKWIIGSHGETCSLLLSIFLSQQNTKIIRVTISSKVAARIFLRPEFVNIL
jgi:hypothetical protein